MAHRKILLFALTEMLGDLLARILADDEVEFVRADDDFVGAVARLRPDVAVVQTPGADGVGQRLVEEPLNVRLLVLVGDGREAVLYDLHPVDASPLEPSPQSLRAALRAQRAETRPPSY